MIIQYIFSNHDLHAKQAQCHGLNETQRWLLQECLTLNVSLVGMRNLLGYSQGKSGISCARD